MGVDGQPLERSLLPQTLTGGHGHCAPGQLTPRGFAQHVALGRHLGRSFAPLLRSIGADHRSNLSHPRMYVRSTDYTRTQMSAAALLYGLLPPNLRPPALPPAIIVTQPQEALETMHGVGLASSSKVGAQDGGGELFRRLAIPRRGAGSGQSDGNLDTPRSRQAQIHGWQARVGD